MTYEGFFMEYFLVLNNWSQTHIYFVNCTNCFLEHADFGHEFMKNNYVVDHMVQIATINGVFYNGGVSLTRFN
jgi:hypothetical protein